MIPELLPTAAALAAVLIAAALAALITRLVCQNSHQTRAAERERLHQSELAEAAYRLTALEERHARLMADHRRAEENLAAQTARSDGLGGRLNAAETELAAAKVHVRRLPSLQAELDQARAEAARLHDRIGELGNQAAAAESQIRHLAAQTEETGRLKTAFSDLQQQLADSRVQNERLATQIATERQAHEEKLALLDEARDALGSRFQHLANQILEEKSRRFSEQNREQLGLLLNPLNEKLGGFSQLVQATYEKEAKERLTLENELKRLQQLNSRLHDDAAALTRALTGSRSKSQGDWGEMILESVLEHSGLQKGREYTVQAASVQTQDDGSTRRLRPDVLVNLPDGKQIVIDSKVSLTGYVRHTQAQSEEEARAALADHIQSVRRHVAELAAKKYSEIDGLDTLDFVFMFIPVEPAYLLALQHDGSLFQECFDKRIMLAGPSTLLATLRTVANIWRNEQQNRNALAIAEEGGRLYDKFAGFVESLQSVGKNLEQAQTAYQKAFGQLKDGRGNLIGRAQKLHRLGVKAGKQIDRKLAEEAAENEETAALIAAGKTEEAEE
ncbi:DNA recombination protein rmuC [Kingella potus]|uniref:DNA recombination protein rmuC n=1 Tax=Kingella potus TaxID=265175 RepID=A0A377QZR3_9NEIS|nr:DNA recombination protein RmuC [Kingella potus]STR00497.1 DNA recombination protein rmuC [Kingella potus]